MIREKIILEYAKDKEVLDIGSVGQSDIYCLWNLMKPVTKELMGVDLPESVDTLKRSFNVEPEGYEHSNDPNIVFGNMETISLNKKFDLVVAGYVIEHTSNQGLFLDNIHKHLKDNGKLILTTPNAKWPTVFLRPNITHTMWHDIHTLTALLERHQFRIETWKYYFGNKPNYPILLLPFLLRQQILIIASKC